MTSSFQVSFSSSRLKDVNYSKPFQSHRVYVCKESGEAVNTHSTELSQKTYNWKEIVRYHLNINVSMYICPVLTSLLQLTLNFKFCCPIHRAILIADYTSIISFIIKGQWFHSQLETIENILKINKDLKYFSRKLGMICKVSTTVLLHPKNVQVYIV